MFEIFRSNFDCLLLLTLFLSELGHFDQNSDVDDEHEHKRHNKRDQGVNDVHALHKVEPVLGRLALLPFARHVVQLRRQQRVRV